MEDTDFNAELTYIAKDIRAIHLEALETRAAFRLVLSPGEALKYQVIIEKLALALIATNRYAKKGKKEKGKEQEDVGNFKEELEALAGIAYKGKDNSPKGAEELNEEFNKLFPIHDALIFAIAKENLFKKKKIDGQVV